MASTFPVATSWPLSEDDAALASATARFARGLDHDVRAAEQRGVFPTDAWKACAQHGLLGLPMPAEYGGTGASVLGTVVAFEAFGYGCRDTGLAFSLASQLFGPQMSILHLGTPAARARFLPDLIAGKTLAADASTEADAGSDLSRIRSGAKRVDGGWWLTATKAYCSLAPLADVFVILARVEEEGGNLRQFIVPREAVAVGSPYQKIGLRTSPLAPISVEGCLVHDEHVLGSGLVSYSSGLEWERLGILASAVGTMQRQLEECVAWARSRKQFGHPIGSYQAIAHRIVEMKRRADTSRLLLYSAAHKKGQSGRATLEAAMVKLHVSESLVANSMDAVRIFGAFGCMSEGGVERDLRDAIPAVIYSGSSDMQRNLIAELLGLPCRLDGLDPVR